MGKKNSAAAVAAPQIDIGIKTRDREKIAVGLSRVLADTYSLYLKTHNFHWNVEGPMFNTLHLMFMDQYTELWNALDAIAERIRSLGYPAPGTGKEFARLTSIAETDGVPEATGHGATAGQRTRGRGTHRAPGLPGRGKGRRRIDLRPAHPAPAGTRKDRVDAAQPAEINRDIPDMQQMGTRLSAVLLAVLACAAAGAAEPRIEIALTFDDLPLNGSLPPGLKQSELARATVKVLKKHRVPPSYGFINARHLERDPDGAQALQVWIDGGQSARRTTPIHIIDLTKNPAEEFQKEILRNEPPLALLTAAEVG